MTVETTKRETTLYKGGRESCGIKTIHMISIDLLCTNTKRTKTEEKKKTINNEIKSRIRV